MDILRNSWKMFTAQEESGPWLHLWRRAKYFFDTDEEFRKVGVFMLTATAVVMLAVICVPWVLARRHRRQVEIMPAQIAMGMMKFLEENQNSLQEIAELLKRPNPEPAIQRVPLPIEPLQQEQANTLLEVGEKEMAKQVAATGSSKNINILFKKQSKLRKKVDPATRTITTK